MTSAQKNTTEKIGFIGYFIIAIFILFILRLWQLQILQGKEYKRLSEANRLRIVNIPAPRGIIFDRNGIPLVENSPYFFASVIPDEFDETKIHLFSKALNMPEEEILSKIKNTKLSPFIPVKLKDGINFNEIAYLEARKSDLPGLIIEVEISRDYIYKNTGSHILGYLGRLTPTQIKDPAYKDIPADIFIGQFGIEKLFDKKLRGIPGKRIIEVNALGKEIRLLQETSPIKGEDINLSIDINFQKAAEKAFGDKVGALVALKPDTGEILSLISNPRFDPNLFTKGMTSEQWLAISKDKRNPLLNRTIQSQYPPGSIFKIVTAVAGLQERLISPELKINCSGEIKYGSQKFGCWKKGGHGTVSLHRAIVESCDVYFYEVGRRVGIDKLAKYARSFGLGEKTGIELAGEKSGVIPDTQWKLKNKKQSWYLGDTFNASIGQGYVALTPIQAAVMINTFANQGILYKPTIIKEPQPKEIGKVNMYRETFNIVKSGLFGVVNESAGTGISASSYYKIAGKTGTAQVIANRSRLKYLPEKYQDHAWFVAFAPVENPEISLSVLVEHGGHGGGAAAPIAKTVIEEYMRIIHPPAVIQNE